MLPWLLIDSVDNEDLYTDWTYNKLSDKQAARFARAYIAGKKDSSGRRGYNIYVDRSVLEMAVKIQIRRTRRGLKNKRTFPNIDYHRKMDNKSCSYCYPDAESYNYISYGSHGRIPHNRIEPFNLRQLEAEYDREKIFL